MAHFNLLDGNVTLSEHDIAQELQKQLDEKPYVTMVVGDVRDYGIDLEFYDEKENRISVPYDSGIYAIYRRVEFGQYECLYCGSGRIYNRLYRYRKELCDCSRGDESHPGAKRTRIYTGIRDDEDLYVRYMTQPERDSIVVKMLCNHLKLKNIDEHVAYLAKARFNKRIKKA
jgi:hypothetical protein